ncbi:MAG TPA: phage tail protein [Lacunisphaera sp.]|nr:phage tail protein [Lacunisphaera sp.]
MNANGTSFRLLFGPEDWGRCQVLHGSNWTALGEISDDEARSVRLDPQTLDLTLAPLAYQFESATGDRGFTPADRRGAAADRYGSWYWIADDRTEIRVLSAGSGNVTRFWPPIPADREPVRPDGAFRDPEEAAAPGACRFAGLAITEDHFLVVGARAEGAPSATPAHLLVFDLHAGGRPLLLAWPASAPFAPFDLAARPGGGVWILDRDQRQLWELDRHFLLVPAPGSVVSPSIPAGAFLDAEDGSPRPPSAAPLPWQATIAMPADGADPIALEVMADNSVLVLENPATGSSRISRYADFARAGSPVSLDCLAALVEDDRRADFRFVAHDFAYVRSSRRLFAVSTEGNQAARFGVALEARQLVLVPHETYFPLRLFSGKALVTRNDQVYYDLAERWMVLVEQRRPRHRSFAELRTPWFDSGVPDCVFHRVMLDAAIPPETVIEVASRSANDEAARESEVFLDEPVPIRRRPGSELPYAAGEDARPTHELLLQHARGRYTQLRLRLRGNRRATPRLRALRIYGPRFSYPQEYLPACYREDPGSPVFLERFLANMEGVLTGIEDRIATVQWLLDARTAPPEALDWLASWWAVALDPDWPAQRKRFFIRHASEFFRWRGTAHGLRTALRLVFDRCVDESIFTDVAGTSPGSRAIRIVEKFRTRRIPGVLLGDVSSGPQARIRPGGRWQPAQGADTLHQLYRQALGTADPAVRYPIRSPAGAAAETAWEDFSLATLGFVPAATTDDTPLWTSFLGRRYLSPARLPAGYGRVPAAMSELALPDRLPSDPEALADWYHFESIVLPTRDSAHQFRVLLPVRGGATGNAALYLNQLKLADRIIQLEKPAHTRFEVRFYWALFRVGDARLGEDTLLGQGSRAPELQPEFVLGEGYLSEGRLGPAHPFNATGRFVLGRDPLPPASTPTFS